MSRSEFEYTVLHGSERLKVTLLDLPEELIYWVDSNKNLVSRIQEALSATYETLTEETLWEIIAENSSEDWKQARDDLKLVENEWNELNSPTIAPLGLIGDALDSHIMSPVAEKLSSSIANFNVINEGLRKREDLTKLLQVFKIVNRIIDSSTETSNSIKRTTEALRWLDTSPKDKFKKASLKVVDSNKTPARFNNIAKLFRSYAQELFKATAKNNNPTATKNKPAL